MTTDDADETMQRLRRRAAQLRAGATPLSAPESPDDEPTEPEPATEPSAATTAADAPEPAGASPEAEAPIETGTAEPEAGTETEADAVEPRAPEALATEPTPPEPIAAATPTDPAPFEMDEGRGRSAIEPGGSDDLLQRWADEDQLTTVEPSRNWSNLVAVVVLVAVVGLGFLGARALLAGSEARDRAATGPAGEDAEAGSVLADDPPSLDDLTSSVTLPPGPDEGLAVAEQGITVVEDRFDATRREGTYAVLVDNPHDDWLAQGVQVQVTFLGQDGQPLGTDQGFIEVVLPSQRVAVASLFFDAPSEPVVGMDIAIDVARWRRTEPFDGGFELADVVTGPAEFSGVVTDFSITSTFDDDLTDVGVTAVYRNADGAVIGGSDTFLDLLEPGVATPAQITLLANVTIEDVASTELYPSAAYGFVPGEGG